MKYHNVGIVIPTKDTWELTEACVDSILACDDLPRAIILVNDHSSDKVKCWSYLHRIYDQSSDTGVTGSYTQIRSTNLCESSGFGPAINSGVAMLLCWNSIDWIILLNNDTVVHSSDWISRILSTANNIPSAGAIGLGHIKAALSQSPPRILTQYSYLGFWFIAIRTEVWKNVGDLDERFVPIYHEDRDWCYRMQEKNYDLVQVFDIDIEHKNNATLKYLGVDTETYGKINHDRFVEKWGFLE